MISAKVYVDHHTDESKGFGFVPNNSVVSAENAIDQMNRFQIGFKRIKVQHRRVHQNHSLAGGGGGNSGEGGGGGKEWGRETGRTRTPDLPPVEKIRTEAGKDGGEGGGRTATKNSAMAAEANRGEGGEYG